VSDIDPLGLQDLLSKVIARRANVGEIDTLIAWLMSNRAVMTKVDFTFCPGHAVPTNTDALGNCWVCHKPKRQPRPAVGAEGSENEKS
jgi:hypothetical protein